MKLVIQVACLLAVLGLSTAQAQTKPRSFIELFGGLASPSGNFTKADYADPASGFAKSGYVSGAQGALFFGGNLGVGLSLSQADYGVNTFALADGYREDFAVDEATAVSRHYKVNSLLVGPYYSLAFGKLTLDLRGLVGLSAATLPALGVALEDQSTFTQNKATATSFAYQVGAGVRYEFLKNIGLSVRADYGSTRPSFVVSYTGVNNDSGRAISRYNETIGTLNGTVGLFYQFGR